MVRLDLPFVVAYASNEAMVARSMTKHQPLKEERRNGNVRTSNR